MQMLDVIERFDAQNRTLEVQTVTEMGEWFSSRYANSSAVMTADDGPIDGPAATLSATSLDDCDLSVLSWRARVSGISVVGTERITLSLPVAGQSEISLDQFGTLRCAGDQGVIYRRHPGTRVSSVADTRKIIFSIPADLLEERVRSHTATELNVPLSFSPAFKLTEPQGAAIKAIASYILSCSVLNSNIEINPLITSSLQDCLFSTLISVLPHNYSKVGAGLTRCDATPRPVRRAEEYMRAHLDEPISLATLAREAGCSERTLQNSFKVHRGTSPIAVLRDIRLDYVRRDLSALEDATVTDIAFKWGFSHLGRFAIAYATKFGEKPSETLLARHKNIAALHKEI